MTAPEVAGASPEAKETIKKSLSYAENDHQVLHFVKHFVFFISLTLLVPFIRDATRQGLLEPGHITHSKNYKTQLFLRYISNSYQWATQMKNLRNSLLSKKFQKLKPSTPFKFETVSARNPYLVQFEP